MIGLNPMDFARRMARRYSPFALIFLLGALLLTINVTSPWGGRHGDAGLAFETAAINHIRFGLGFTKGQDYFDLNVWPPQYSDGVYHPLGISSAHEIQYLRTGPVHPYLYGHHPPLLGLTIAISLLTFGYQFWAVRLVPIVFTLGGLVLFYVLLSDLFDRRAAAFAALLFISFPITAYYGRNVAHEAPTLCFELGMALCYVQWRKSGQTRWLASVAICVALGVAYGWPMVFFAWILWALDVLATRRVNWHVTMATVGVATIMFGLVVAQIAWAAGWSLDTLRDAFLLRASSSGVSASGGMSEALYWIVVLMLYNLGNFGIWTWFALPVSLRFLIGRARRERFSLRVQIIALFGLGGCAHILIFRDGAAVHDYWQFYLIPFYAAVIGWGGSALAGHIATVRLVARLRTRIATESLILIGFSALALVMAAPLIHHLYAIR